MEKMNFNKFKDLYLNKFRKYYRDEYTNKKELKRSVYDNPKLSQLQKDKFWELVVSKGE